MSNVESRILFLINLQEAPSPPPAKKQKGGVLKRHLQEGSKKGKSKAETDSTSDSGPDDVNLISIIRMWSLGFVFVETQFEFFF